ncbi:MAG TPA: hypothetical protein VGK48_17325 [Terriglobia bacterium]
MSIFASSVSVDGFWDYNNTEGYTLFTENYNNPGDSGCGKGNCDQGILGVATDATNLYLMFAQPLSVVDNSYGTNAVGWAKGHKFSDLTGSDEATFVITSGSTTLFNSDIDYVSQNAPYVSGGNSSGDGSNNAKMSPGVLDGAATSIQWDLASGNNTCGAPTTNSPDIDGNSANTNSPNATYNSNGTNNQVGGSCGTWVFPVIYEISLTLSSLGLSPFANPNAIHSQLDVTIAHDSPSKTGETPNVCTDGVVGPSGSNASVALGCSSVVTTPEPASIQLLGLGILMMGLLLYIPRRKQRFLP